MYQAAATVHSDNVMSIKPTSKTIIIVILQKHYCLFIQKNNVRHQSATREGRRTFDNRGLFNNNNKKRSDWKKSEKKIYKKKTMYI